MGSTAGKTKWETHLSSADHARAEDQRLLLGLSRAAYARAALRDRRLLDGEAAARMAGLTGQGLFDLVEIRRVHSWLGSELDPIIARLREAVLLVGGDDK